MFEITQSFRSALFCFKEQVSFFILENFFVYKVFCQYLCTRKTKNRIMKHSLFILFLATSPFIFSQETIKDSLQELPKPEQKAYRKAQLERALSKIWELDREDQRGTFKLVEYLPMYVMPFRFTDKPTEQPISLNPDRPIPEWRDYQHIETKFQVSLKAKIMQDAFGKGDVWVAFTQQSYWQMYNGELSRPFRELNYEPELIFTYPLNFSAGNL